MEGMEMNGTQEREVHGHKISELPATQDAKCCIDYLLRAYPEWMLRKGGQMDRVMALAQRLEQSVRDGDVEAICHIRVNLRDSQRKMEQSFGARDYDTTLVLPSGERVKPKRGAL